MTLKRYPDTTSGKTRLRAPPSSIDGLASISTMTGPQVKITAARRHTNRLSNKPGFINRLLKLRKRSKRGKRSKYACQIKHAQRRALERYGIHCSYADLISIRDQIQSQRAAFVERQSHRVTVWDLTHQQKEVRVVYDNQRKMIVTFLPPEAREDFEHERRQ